MIEREKRDVNNNNHVLHPTAVPRSSAILPGEVLQNILLNTGEYLPSLWHGRIWVT